MATDPAGADRREVPDQDPTLVRNQPALRTPRRRRWLVPGGVLAAVAIGMLAATLQLERALPMIGIILVVAIYLAMLIVAVAVHQPRRRDAAFAWLMVAMTLAALVVLALVVLREWSG